MSDPCDESNWDIDYKNHSPLNGLFLLEKSCKNGAVNACLRIDLL